MEHLGTSEAGRPIEVYFAGESDAPLKVLLLAGQHGDEILSRAVGTAFTAMSYIKQATPSGLQVAIVPNVNPDGAALNSPRNLLGIDLNRDHQTLHSAECVALHQFVRQWRPHLVIDVHTDPPGSKPNVPRGLQVCHDVLLGVASHPAIAPPLADTSRLIEDVCAALSNRGFVAGEYASLSESSRLRHNTGDVIDARNHFALRYGCLTILVEGRHVENLYSFEAETHIQHAMRFAVKEILAWASERLSLFLRPPVFSSQIPIRSRSEPREVPALMPFYDLQSKETVWLEAGINSLQIQNPTHYVTPPAAYAVPLAKERLIALLHKHGFESRMPEKASYPVQVTRLKQGSLRPEKHRSARRVQRLMTRDEMNLEGYLLFITRPEDAAALAVYLEPCSTHALHRYPDLQIALQAGHMYPIIRVCTDPVTLEVTR